MTLEQAEREAVLIEERLKLLRTFIESGRKLEALEAQPVGSGDEDGDGVHGTAAFAESVLRARGRSRLSEVVEAMRRAGWKGSGELPKDKRRAYAAMHRLPDVFVSLGDTTWELKAQRGNK